MNTTTETKSRVGEKPTSTLLVALAGNPNAGKTTLFNALTGLRQKVANYPGVTVERKEGIWTPQSSAHSVRLIDLPGLYSLDAASIDERIARDVITGRIVDLPAPDVIIVVVDATNLERNLFLVTQLLEFGRPMVIALTMMDLAKKRGIEIDTQALSTALGVRVVPVIATQRQGIDNLARAVEGMNGAQPKEPGWRLSEQGETEIAELSRSVGGNTRLRRSLIRELFANETPSDPTIADPIEQARRRLEIANPLWWQEPLTARYDWIEQISRRSVHGITSDGPAVSERIDRVLTHKYMGPILLIAVMLLVFQTIFAWASVPTDLIDRGFGALGDLVRNTMPAGLLADLIVDGVIAGVGGVITFLPQILLLFFFIAILEDTGYMARAAFLMDRLMRSVGLHGKAFMPLMSSFACAIPGIMATRTIENPKDRLATILIAPFMSCSARLPVYTLMIAAFFSEKKIFGFLSVGALLILAMYLLGMAVAIGVAWILKHTILKAPTPPLVLELPPYRIPVLGTIAQMMMTRAWLFVKKAGTVILAISIVLWALATFPRTVSRTQAEPSGSDVKTVEVKYTDKSEQLSNSFAGRGGKLLEPIISPLGFDWKMGVGLISSFAARETLVSTLSIMYNVDGSGDSVQPGSQSNGLIKAVRDARRTDGSPAWTPLVALSMMVFFVLAMQCMSTVAVVRRETNSWRWPLFMIGYMTAMAYLASLMVYQGGRFFGLG